jgi:hypothetical protein
MVAPQQRKSSACEKSAPLFSRMGGPHFRDGEAFKQKPAAFTAG